MADVAGTNRWAQPPLSPQPPPPAQSLAESVASQPQWGRPPSAQALRRVEQPQWAAQANPGVVARGVPASPPSPSTPSPSEAAAAAFTRDEERELAALAAQEADQDPPLAPEQRARLAALSARYQAFLDAGVQKLQLGAQERNARLAASPTSAALASTGKALKTLGKGALFWGSLMATAVPGYIGKNTGLTPDFRHWNWVGDRLILGAIPVVTQIGGSGRHLELLGEQCAARNIRIGLVVCCVESAELSGFGIRVVEFAGPKHWEQTLGVTRYEHVPIADFSAGVDYNAVLHAVEAMHECMHERREAVYVHCKAGKGRSWMVSMCYLQTYGEMPFETACAAVLGARKQVNPSASQVQFARDFALRWHANRSAAAAAAAASAQVTQ